MKIRVPIVDGRSFKARMLGPHEVVDQETGKVVGWIEGHRGSELSREPSWAISLFGKYHGSFDTRQECQGFAAGVETVLNHVVSMPKSDSTQDVA